MFSQMCCNSVVIYLRILALVSSSEVINTCAQMNCHVPVHTSSFFLAKLMWKVTDQKHILWKKCNCEHFRNSLSSGIIPILTNIVVYNNLDHVVCLQHLGHFGPLKCKEIYALAKLRRQADIIERLMDIARAGSEVTNLQQCEWGVIQTHHAHTRTHTQSRTHARTHVS